MSKKKGGIIENTVSREDFFHSFILLYESNFPNKKGLSVSERKLLVGFMLLAREDMKYRYNLFGTIAKKKMGERLGLKKSNLEVRLHEIKKKNYVIKDLDGLDSLMGPLTAILDSDELELNFIFKIKDDV